MQNPILKFFLQAAKKLNATNDNSIVFEDSVAGIQAANIANMTSIGIGDADNFTRSKIHI